MKAHETKGLAQRPDAIAPDGAEVRLLASTASGSMAHFQLATGQASMAVTHRTVDELWFILAGTGEMWRKGETIEEVTTLQPGLSLSIPLGTHFQFRNTGAGPLQAVAVTMPPWPGAEEAVAVKGRW